MTFSPAFKIFSRKDGRLTSIQYGRPYWFVNQRFLIEEHEGGGVQGVPKRSQELESVLFFLYSSYSLYSSAFVTLHGAASGAPWHRDRARTLSAKSGRDARYHRRAAGRLVASKYGIVY